MFENITVKSRLLILIAVLTLGLGLSFVFRVYSYFAISSSINDLHYGGAEEISDLHTISNNLNSNLLNLSYLVYQGKISWEDADARIREGRGVINEAWRKYLKDMTDLDTIDSNSSAIIEGLKKHMDNVNLSIDRLEKLLQQKDKEALASFYEKEAQIEIIPVMKEIDQLIQWNVVDTRKDYNNAKSTLLSNLIMTFVIFLLTLLITSILAYLIIKSITTPLNQAVNAINQLASGDTNLEIKNPFKDEFGSLFDSMEKMNTSNKKMVSAVATFSTGDLNVKVDPRSERDILAKALNEMAGSAKKMSGVLNIVANGDLTIDVQPRSAQDTLGFALAKMTKNLNQIIGELQNEITTLTTSSEEIVGSVSQVASGSAETAAAVTETTSSVEELKQTTHISDEKAKDVLLCAEETLQIVKDSEKSLQTTIEDMNQINDKMHIISTSIVKLSEHSQTIREIIDSVNDLAEQSNLLAVNAAIEAAKAGEHGKSFAVVAQEIRTLAEQSKGATVQVRAILNDIQNSTSEAVLATEQGSKAVEKGVSQSSQTSEFMQKLAQGMTRVAQAANQIAITSQQQLMGVDQVTVAMNSISDAATQHVEHMKQIETAVVSLNSVGSSLKDIADKYSIYEEELKDKKGRKRNVAEF